MSPRTTSEWIPVLSDTHLAPAGQLPLCVLPRSQRWLLPGCSKGQQKLMPLFQSDHIFALCCCGVTYTQVYTSAEVTQGGRNALTDELTAANKPFYPTTTGIASTSRMYIPCFAMLPSAGKTNSGAAVSMPVCSVTKSANPSPRSQRRLRLHRHRYFRLQYHQRLRLHSRPLPRSPPIH